MQELAIYRLNTGSCNGCDIEVVGALAERFRLGDAGARAVGEPENANVLLVTGVVTSKMKEHLKHVYEKIKPPKIVVAAGSCALSSGVFEGSYNIPNLVDEVISVNAYVPGCPPSPHAIVGAIADVTRAKLPSWRPPEDFRGVPEVDDEKCVGCAACVEMCPAGAIDIVDEGSERTVRFSHAKCIFCALCEEVCPEDAIKMAARYHIAAKNKDEITDEAKLELAKCTNCGALFVPSKQLQKISERILEDVGEYRGFRGAIEKSMGICQNCRTLLENARAAKSLLFSLNEAVRDY